MEAYESNGTVVLTETKRKAGRSFGMCVCQGEGLERYCESQSFKGF